MRVAVRSVRVMEMPGDDMVEVVGVRHGFVTAIRSVLVRGIVSGTGVTAVAVRRILCVRCERMFVDVPFVDVVQVSVVNVIDVVVVTNRGVSAICGVLVLMLGMQRMR